MARDQTSEVDSSRWRRFGLLNFPEVAEKASVIDRVEDEDISCSSLASVVSTCFFWAPPRRLMEADDDSCNWRRRRRRRPSPAMILTSAIMAPAIVLHSTSDLPPMPGARPTMMERSQSLLFSSCQVPLERTASARLLDDGGIAHPSLDTSSIVPREIFIMSKTGMIANVRPSITWPARERALLAAVVTKRQVSSCKFDTTNVADMSTPNPLSTDWRRS
mmetsp:Transcript_18601/g.53439  ORF Transcript_18601/g.53439 Transcript_18601/m.53439 type:complete len:219 (+) Transcript_18601:2529-3185(+)